MLDEQKVQIYDYADKYRHTHTFLLEIYLKGFWSPVLITTQMVYLIRDKALHVTWNENQIRIFINCIYVTFIHLFWKAVLHVDIHTTKVKKKKEKKKR